MPLSDIRLSTDAAELARVVQKEGHILNREILKQVFDLFAKNVPSPDFENDLRELMPEYGRQEYLLCVNANGKPVELSKDLVNEYDEMRGKHLAFGKWFQAADSPVGKTLLPARWLCHLAGIRHRAVQLFLDDPFRAGYTLVQVRSSDKAEAPGCFDIPVAGHIDFLMEGEETLMKEMQEELGLERQDLEDLTFITGYDAIDDGPQAVFQSAEYRLVWRGRMKKDAWEKIIPGSHEVAGIASFSKDELPKMIQQFPARFASGIKASLPYYISLK